MAKSQKLENVAVGALVFLQRAALWLIVAVPFALGIVGGFVVRLARLLWAALVEGYTLGVGNA